MGEDGADHRRDLVGIVADDDAKIAAGKAAQAEAIEEGIAEAQPD